MSFLPGLLPFAGAALGTMVPGIGPMLGAGLGMYAGGVMGQQETNSTNVALGREQMDFQERMRSTAYQTAVADMKSAGLNPMLAYSQGGAPMASGSMPQVANSAAVGMSSAQQGLQAAQGLANVELTRAQAGKVRSETLANDVHLRAAEQGIGVGQARASLDFQKQMTEYERRGLTEEQRHHESARRALAELELDFGQDTYSARQSAVRADSARANYSLSEAKASSQFYDEAGPGIKWLREILGVLRGVPRRR